MIKTNLFDIGNYITQKTTKDPQHWQNGSCPDFDFRYHFLPWPLKSHTNLKTKHDFKMWLIDDLEYSQRRFEHNWFALWYIVGTLWVSEYTYKVERDS